jgi:HipA-like protein
MRVAEIYYNRVLAGTLTESDERNYTFIYDDRYLSNPLLPAVSLTLPKTQRSYEAPYLFPFFYNMLAEGVNRQLQSRQLRIDEDDSFGFLLATAASDTIGAITVKPLGT